MDAWEELSREDYDAVWQPFQSRFRFRPSMTTWPGFSEPSDSVTYGVGGAYGDAERYERMTMDLSRKLVAALRRCVTADSFVYALDWQHPAYTFRPHVPFSFKSEADWPVPAFPNGEYYCFVDPTMECGLLGHPWEQTICVFGSNLLAAFEPDPPVVFGQPVRIRGKPL